LKWACWKHRGLEGPWCGSQVAVELTEKDVIRAHARDELGIDLDELSNPWTAAAASAVAFVIGAGMPLLSAAFIESERMRIMSLVLVSTTALAGFGILGAVLGGANWVRGGARVIIGGWIAMGITYGVGRAFNIRSIA
jgi:vacuolar iron transporter family protein